MLHFLLKLKVYFGQSVGKTNTYLIPEALYLDLEGLKKSKTETQRERGIKNCDPGQDYYYVGGVG